MTSSTDAVTSSADVMTSSLAAVTSSVVAAVAVRDTLAAMAVDLTADLQAAAYRTTKASWAGPSCALNIPTMIDKSPRRSWPFVYEFSMKLNYLTNTGNSI